MTHQHINLIYPQWQGGGDLSTCGGVLEFRKLYLAGASVEEISVSRDEPAVSECGIFGYADILIQTEYACSLLNREQPDTLFTVGGGCDVSAPAVSYLNARLDNKLTVLWLDAHGDLNTPESSPSGLFHGMPLRLLLGEGDSRLLKLLHTPLDSEQIMLAGVRDLDEPEREYIAESRMDILTTEALCDSEAIADALREKGNHHIYVHIDLDVLEPSKFAHVPLPVAGGLDPDALVRLLHNLNGEFEIAGLSVVEYMGAGGRRCAVLEEIARIGAALAQRSI